MFKTNHIVLICFSILSLLSCKNNKDVDKKADHNFVANQVNNYNEGIGKVNVMGFFVEPQFAGTLHEDGSLELNLPEDFINVSQKAFDAYNQLSDSEYELSGIKVADVFSPLENLEITGQNTELALAGKYYGFEIHQNGVKTGRLFPGSSQKFIEYNINATKNEPLEGYFYMYIYSEGIVNIAGKNGAPLEADEQGNITRFSSQSYDVKLVEGWNIVKYEVKSVAQLSDGKLQVVESAFVSIPMDQAQIEWHYLSIP